MNSDKLLSALDKLKRTEQRKRDHKISTPEFHRLAEEVDQESERVWRLAEGEEAQGDAIDQSEMTINADAEEEGARRLA